MRNDTRFTNHIVKLGGVSLNLTTMSKDLEVSVSHLSRVIAGKRNPSIKLSRRLAHYMNMSIDSLLKEIG